MSKPVRVGVVGCGLIAQVMHLPYSSELDDRFEIAAVRDGAPVLPDPVNPNQAAVDRQRNRDYLPAHGH